MKSKRFGIIVVSAVAGVLLAACNGTDSAADAASSAGSGRQVTGGHTMPSGHASAPGHGSGTDIGQSGAGRWDKNQSDATFFGSILDGASEVPVQGKPAVGDKDGSALGLMRIQGDEVSYAFAFTGTQTPTLGHLHKGVKGVNGDVVIPFFTKKLEDGTNFAVGTVTVDDHDLLERIKTNPQNWYFNIHTGEFPGGAVRGQAYKLAPGIHVPDTMNADTLDSVVKATK